VQLLASFIGVWSEYALARLELAFRHADAPAPPVIDRLADASEESLRDQWDDVERQLNAALRFVKHGEAALGIPVREDPAFAWLARSVRQMDQYARAVRWVLTVTERDEA